MPIYFFNLISVFSICESAPHMRLGDHDESVRHGGYPGRV